MISGNVKVYGEAKINGGDLMDNAEIYEKATVNSGATISDNAKVHGEAVVGEDVYVSGNADIDVKRELEAGTYEEPLMEGINWFKEFRKAFVHLCD